MTHIKVVALEVDDTVWKGRLDRAKFGKGPNASSKLEDNLEMVADGRIRDRSNHANHVDLFPDIPKIVHDIVKRGIKLAIVSSNSSEALCNRALFFYQANDAQGKPRSIISFVKYNEVGKGDLRHSFDQIKEWSQASHQEIIYFSSHSSANDARLGIEFEVVSKYTGLTWDQYHNVVNRGNGNGGNGKGGKGTNGDRYDIPFYDQPSLGKFIGEGKFAKVYESLDNNDAVIKVLKVWTTELRLRYVEIYNIIKKGQPFKPGTNKEDQYLFMVALELRNLHLVKQLKAPEPENFSGWFTITKIHGTPLWKTNLYRKHPFSVPFQDLVKTACHLAIDEIERVVKKYGVEHQDAHLANVYFEMQGDTPVKAHLLDWGIAVLMKWDGDRYVRGADLLVWSDSKPGHKYTPEELRRYWIDWMVKTEYEANMKRHSITDNDGNAFLKDLDWWYTR